MFAKPALTSSALLAHIVVRGLCVPDTAKALHALEHIGYYRLLIYMRPLQSPGGKWFNPGSSFDQLLALYEFDRQLRLLCMDAIERLEVALRTAIINTLGLKHGPHFYQDPSQFVSNQKWFDHGKLIKQIDDTESLGISHYRKKYTSPTRPPIWVVLEAATFGTLSRILSALTPKNRDLVATHFSEHERVLVSWFRSLTALRNVCAHHSRLWNAQMKIDSPIAAKRYAAEFPSVTTAYARLVVIAVLLNDVDPAASAWKQRVKDLFAVYPTVSPRAIGCPAGWESRSIWA